MTQDPAAAAAHTDASLFVDDPLLGLEDHLAGLRRLARALTGDAVEAEDLVQDTWLAWRQVERPTRITRMRAWLEQAMRNRASNRRRGDRRRTDRERSAAAEADGEAPTTLSVVERRERLTAVLDAIATLPDPLEQCVVLRWFDDLPPRAIAARLDTTVDVVHGRLKRARYELRARLGGERGRRELLAALGLALPPLPAAAATATTATATAGSGSASVSVWTPTLHLIALMTTKKLFAGAAGIVLLALLTSPFWSPEAAPESTERIEAAAAPTDSAADLGPADGLPAQEREPTVAAEPTAHDASWLGTELPHEFALAFTVTNADDLLAAGIEIVIAPDGLVPNVVGETDERGRLVVRWRGRRPSMDVLYGLAASSDSLQRLTVSSGSPTAVPLRTDRATALTVIGTAFRYTEVTLTDVPVGSSWSSRAVQARVDEDGWTWFAGPPAAVERIEEVAELTDVTVDSVANVGRFMHVIGGLNTPTKNREERPMTTLRGRVLDANGTPVAKALVIAGPVENSSRGTATRTDDQGRYELPGLAGDATLFVRAGGRSRGLATTTLTSIGSGVHEWDATLDRGNELALRIVDADGQPCVKWNVRVLGAPTGTGEARWIDYAATDEDGIARIPNAGSGPYDVAVWADGSPAGGFPFATWPAQWLDAAQRALVVPQVGKAADLLASLQVDLRDTAGDPIRDGAIRLENAAGRVVVTSSPMKAGRSVRGARVPPGSYTLSVARPGNAWSLAGQVELGAGETSDRGPVTVPARRLIRLNAPDPESTIDGRAATTLAAIGDDLVVEVYRGPWGDLDGRLAVPSASVAWRIGDRTGRRDDLIAGGATAEIDVTATGDGDSPSRR